MGRSLRRVPEGVALAERAGFELISPAEGSAYLWSRGRMRPLPTGTVMGMPTDEAAPHDLGNGGGWSISDDGQHVELLGSLCTDAMAGRFDEAAATARLAQKLATDAGNTNLAAKNLELETMYQSHQAYHEPVKPTSGAIPP